MYTYKSPKLNPTVGPGVYEIGDAEITGAWEIGAKASRSGKCWAAIKGDKLTKLTSMAVPFDYPEQLPNWVARIRDVDAFFYVRDYDNRRSSKSWQTIRQTAVEAGHPATGPRGGQIRPAEILAEAREISREEDTRQFLEFRKKTKAELAKHGERVVSGERRDGYFFARDENHDG